MIFVIKIHQLKFKFFFFSVHLSFRPQLPSAIDGEHNPGRKGPQSLPFASVHRPILCPCLFGCGYILKASDSIKGHVTRYYGYRLHTIHRTVSFGVVFVLRY